MGRRFTSASTEDIDCSGAAYLGGYTHRSGTVAVCFNPITLPGSAVYACFIAWNVGRTDPAPTGGDFEIENGRLIFWNGVEFVERGDDNSLVVDTPWIGAMTKSSGQAIPRFHTFRFSTNTWTHNQFSDNMNDIGHDTEQLTMGTYDGGSGDPLNAEVWAIATWPRPMTDSEIERLARGNWLNYSPAFYEQWSDGREVGDMARTLGRHPVRQSSRTGTSRGATKPPPGFRMDARRRRR